MIELGNRLEPFVDRFLVDELEEVEQRLHHPQPAGPVLTLDRPWEGAFSGYPTLIYQGGEYRLYYRGWSATTSNAVTCVARSTDGVHFERPELDFPSHGQARTNVLLTGNASHNFTPFYDTKPRTPADQRFKALADTRVNGARGLQGFVSSDGYQWTPLREEPVLTQGAFDSQNLAFWSSAENCYVAYYRYFEGDGAITEYKGLRAICRAVSDDFLNWSQPQKMDLGAPLTEHLYTNATHPYFRAPHIYLALPKRFIPEVARFHAGEHALLETDPTQQRGLSDVILLTSRGGATYDRCFPQALVRPGADPRNWSARAILPGPSIVPTGPREMSFYAIENYGHPAPVVQRYALRTDGLASLNAGYRPGTFRSKPFTFTGQTLTLNASTSAYGCIKAELQTEQGQPLPGLSLDDAHPLRGDDLCLTCRWGDRVGVAQYAGQPVRLKLQLCDADVYALQFV